MPTDSGPFAGIVSEALSAVRNGMTVGLGTGRAASAFVSALGERVQAGMRIRGVATSEATTQLAHEVGIPLVNVADVPALDLAVDGADEVAPNLDLIKGLGGALMREKIIASSAKRFVILVGAEKLVPHLGSRGVLPVEVVPFAAEFCRRRIEAMGYPAEVRGGAAQPFLTDNGNYVLHCRMPAMEDPIAVETALRGIPGVVTTGLFLGMADTVLVQDGPSVRILHRPTASGECATAL